MGKQEKKRFRSEIANDLIAAGELLEREGVCSDSAPLKVAANQCIKCGGDYWQYDVSNLILRLGGENETLPPGLANLDCRLNARIAGLCSQMDLRRDPMTHAEIDLTLEGTSQENGKKYIQAWHFDRHISEGNSGEPAKVHPRYHFHFGGDQMKTFLNVIKLPCFDFILLLDGPRIAHPPLDGILMIDFILANFVEHKWKALRAKPRYKNIVFEAQRRNWKPFVNALSYHWGPNQNQPWEAADIWPDLCVL